MAVGEEAAQTILQITSKTALMTSETLMELLKLLHNRLANNNVRTNNTKLTDKDTTKSGKQSLKSLSKQNVALDSIPVSNIDIKALTAQLKRYGIDFSVTKNRQSQDFNLFFKGTDTAAISAALEQIVKGSEQSQEETKKPLKEQKESAQQKAETQNKAKAEEKAKSQEQQKNRSGREQDR